MERRATDEKSQSWQIYADKITYELPDYLGSSWIFGALRPLVDNHEVLFPETEGRSLKVFKVQGRQLPSVNAPPLSQKESEITEDIDKAGMLFFSRVRSAQSNAHCHKLPFTSVYLPPQHL